MNDKGYEQKTNVLKCIIFSRFSKSSDTCSWEKHIFQVPYDTVKKQTRSLFKPQFAMGTK